MRKGIGISCIVMGIFCLLTAIGFVVYNQYEATNGEKASQILLRDLQINMNEANQESTVSGDRSMNTWEEAPTEMQTVTTGSYDSIGILGIPVLGLELPVLTDWSYEKLKSAPCHYYGSYYKSDFVIAAHNYPTHFGGLSQLRPGDLVLFTNVIGEVYSYEVVLLETLAPTATEEMINSGFDLSMYTCTPGGGSRVTVRCNLISDWFMQTP